MDFSIDITREDILDIDNFIDNYLVSAMNNSGMSTQAMLVTLQTLVDKVAELKEKFESGDDNAL